VSSRRLLLIAYFFPPLAGGGVHRVLGFTRHLPDHGWSCTVICAGPEDYWVTDEALADSVRPDTEVIRVAGGSAIAAWLRWWRGDRGRRSGGTFAALRSASNWTMFPDSYVGWSRRAARVAERIVRERAIDVVLTSSPPDSVHRVGLELRRRHDAPWVADFRDPWMGLVARTPPTRWHRARQEALERQVLERADLVLAASRTHADALVARLADGAARVVHLPNGFEADATPTPPSVAEPVLPGPDTFLLVYTGVLSLMPDTEVFLEAVHDLLAVRPEARRRLRVRLVGPFEAGYTDRAVALGLTPGIVEFTGPRAHREARALQRRADLLMLWQPRNFPTMVPGKLYEYLDAARPIVAVVDPAIGSAAMVRRAGGTVVSPGDREALTEALGRHYAAWREGRALTAERPEWLHEHTRAGLSARLARRLDALVGAAT
jgi:glycosyltransferase involved in cell wall biosynthesis